MEQGRRLFEQGRFEEAEKVLQKDVDLYPEHHESYRWLAEASEMLGKKEAAAQAWKDFRTLAKGDAERNLADERLAALAGAAAGDGLSQGEIEVMSVARPEWYTKDTAHFSVKTRNEKLTQYVSDQAEIFLGVLCKKLLGGAAYAHKVPITVYRDHREYVAAGNMEWSGGVTSIDYFSFDAIVRGKVERRIDLFQLDEKGKLSRELVCPRTIPHELTHLVLSEHFGQTPIPMWLNEGIAQYVEKGRRAEADKLVAEMSRGAGVIPLKTLIALPAYPKEHSAIAAFYHQSSSFTAWLVESLADEGFAKFIRDVKQGRSAEVALQNCLGGNGKSWLTDTEKAWLESIRKRYPAEK